MSRFETVEKLLERATETGEDTVAEARRGLESILKSLPSVVISEAINEYIVDHSAVVFSHSFMAIETRQRMRQLALMRLAKVRLLIS